MTRRMKRIAQVGAMLLFILLLGIWLGTRRPEPDTARGESAVRPSGMAAPVPTIAALDSSLRALADGERGSPRDRWDPEWLARRFEGNPDVLLAWVRIHTRWIPYHGVLRGAPGVLQDRQGNSLDRAILLASLLEHSGHSVRLAHADLGAERATRELPALSSRRATFAAPAQHTDASVWRPVVRQIAAQYGLDAEAVAGSLSAGVASTDGALGTLDQRVENQVRRLQRHLSAGAEPTVRMDSALSALRDHWWVQRLDGDRWVDLDPLGMITDSASLPAWETVELRSLQDSMYHRVSVRLVTESWARGGLHERIALESELRPAELMGLPISLQVWPTEWPTEIQPTGSDARGAVHATALAQREWHAVLVVGAEPRAEAVINVSGESRHPEAGGPMGGLGRGIVGALGNTSDLDAFTAAWLEYETKVPGREVRRERRVLFDLPGPAARATGLTVLPEINDGQRATRNLALMRQTEILPLGSVPDPGYVLHLTSQAAQANMLLLRTRLADTSGQSDGALMDMAEQIATPPSPLYTLAIARFAGDEQGDVFLDRPNVLSRHLWLRPVAGGAVRAEANDIVLNDVGVAVDVADGAATRLRQGIRDTNGEALFPSTARVFGSVGEAFAAPGDWIVATSASDPSLGKLRASADTRLRMEQELSAGYVLVVQPTSDKAGADVEGWWRIDPSTGHALGVSSSGWGQTLMERAVKYGSIFQAAWAFEYLICRNGLYGLPGEPGARTDGTVGFLLVKPAHAQTQFCSINALIAGILALGQEIAAATWPLVLRTIAGRGYSGILSDRPWFATGAGDPGDLPPIFGNRPGSGTPEPECPSAGGAAPSQRPSGEPGTPEPEPARPAEPAEPSEGTGQPSAGEEGRPVPREEDMPYYADDRSGMTPVPPEHIEAKIPPAKAHSDAMEREFDNAVADHQRAARELEAADRAFEVAKARDDQVRRDYPIDSPERLQAAEEWNATNREARAKAELAEAAAKQVRRAQYNVEVGRYRVSYLTRLAQANRAAYEAAQARNAAATAWERTGMTDYNSPEYAQFRAANERFRAAQRELSDRFWNQESPARPTDNTVPAPTEPAPPAAPAPGPGGNAPGGAVAPAGCGGGPASPRAESVVGVVGAGAGVAGGK